jgi:hypothetical protein
MVGNGDMTHDSDQTKAIARFSEPLSTEKSPVFQKNFTFFFNNFNKSVDSSRKSDGWSTHDEINLDQWKDSGRLLKETIRHHYSRLLHSSCNW